MQTARYWLAAKAKPQMPHVPTMTLHDAPETKVLTEDDILLVATQPPKFRRRYARYWNSNGKIREAALQEVFVNVIFLTSLSTTR
jgi:hypothetical protein